jgi:flagellar biosynthetic protein FlhB
MGRPSSSELTAAFAFAAAAIGLPSVAASSAAAFGALWNAAIGAARSPHAPAVFAPLGPAKSGFAQVTELAQLGAGMLVALALTAAAASALQRGVFVRIAGAGGATFDARIPLETISSRLARTVFSLAKWIAFAAALFAPWSDAVRGMLGAWQRTPSELVPIAGVLMLAVLERAAIALAVLGAIDFAVQQVALRRRLRMSRHELREEQKATEADPHATAERKRRGRELQAHVALQELEEVTLVVCDLEGRAFGVRAREAEMTVWIKAEGDLAARVRKEADVKGVPVRIDRDLAAACARVEIGEALPAAVADDLRRARGS